MSKKHTMILILIILSFLIIFLFFKQIREINFFEKKDSSQALIYLDSGEYEKAEKIYLDLVEKKNSGYVGDLFYLGKVYYLQKKIEEAKNVFKQVASEATDNIDVKNSIIFLALIAEDEGNCDLAIEYINRYSQEIPDFSLKENSFLENIPLVLSKCYFKKGEIDKSLSSIEEKLSEDMDDHSFSRLIVQLADNNLFLANYEKSFKLFNEERLDEKTKQKRKGFIAMSLLGQEKYDEILDLLSTSFFTLDKENLAYAYYSLGIVEMKKGDKDKAEEAFQNIYNQAIKFFDVDNFGDFYRLNLLRYYGLGALSLSKNNKIEAINYFQKIIDMIEEIPEYRMEDFKNKIDIYFLSLSVKYELAQLSNFSDKEIIINDAQRLISNLTKEEQEIIERKNIGTGVSIIESIKKLSKEINEKN